MCISINVDHNMESNENVFCANVHALYLCCKEYIMQASKEIGIKVSKDTIDNMFKWPLKYYTKDGNATMRMYAKVIMDNKDSNMYYFRGSSS